MPISLIAFFVAIMHLHLRINSNCNSSRIRWIPSTKKAYYFAILIFTRCLAAVSVLNLLILVTPITTVTGFTSMVPCALSNFRYHDADVQVHLGHSLRGKHTNVQSASSPDADISHSVSYLKKVSNYGTMAGALLLRSFDRAIKSWQRHGVQRHTQDKYTLFTYETKKMPKWDMLIGALVVIASVSVVLLD